MQVVFKRLFRGVVIQYNVVAVDSSGGGIRYRYGSFQSDFFLRAEEMFYTEMKRAEYEGGYPSAKPDITSLKEYRVKCSELCMAPQGNDMSTYTTVWIYKLPGLDAKAGVLKILHQLRMSNPKGFPQLEITRKNNVLNYKTLEREGICLQIANRADICWETILMIIVELFEKISCETDLTLFEGRIADEKLNFSIIGYEDQLKVEKSLPYMFPAQNIKSAEKKEDSCAVLFYPSTINYDVISPSPPSYDSILTSKYGCEFQHEADAGPI